MNYCNHVYKLPWSVFAGASKKNLPFLDATPKAPKNLDGSDVSLLKSPHYHIVI